MSTQAECTLAAFLAFKGQKVVPFSLLGARCFLSVIGLRGARLYKGIEDDISVFEPKSIYLRVPESEIKAKVYLELIVRKTATTDSFSCKFELLWKRKSTPKPDKTLLLKWLWNPLTVEVIVPRVRDVPAKFILAGASGAYGWNRGQELQSKTPSQLLQYFMSDAGPRYLRYKRRMRSVLGSYKAFYNAGTRPNPVTGTSQDLQGNAVNGVWDNQSPFTFTQYFRGFSGTRTPNFRKLRPGQLPVNEYSLTYYRTVHRQAYGRQSSPGTVYENLRSIDVVIAPGTEGYPDLNMSYVAAYNKAVNRLAEKADSSLQANLAQDLAQYGQLQRLVVSTANRFHGAVLALRKRDKSAAIDALLTGRSIKSIKKSRRGATYSGTLASNWLELQYAWKPLLKDIEGLIQLQKQYFNRSASEVKVIRASARVERNSTSLVPHNLMQPADKAKYPGFGQHSSLTLVKFGMRYRLRNESLSYLSQTGFTNPINLAWEVLPFSFVYDWFHPLGPYFESFSNFEGLTLVDGFQTTFTRWGSSIQFNTNAPSLSVPGAQLFVTGGRDEEWIRHIRTRLTTFPKNLFPQFRNPYNATRAVNAIALLRSVFGGRR